MRKLIHALALAGALSSCVPVAAQTPSITGNEFQTQTPGKTVVGVVGMCVNGSNQAIPCPSGGSSTTAAQGSPNTTANAWPVKITDGTNVGAVKAASTAPVATDPALVTVLSPNQPSIPTNAVPSSASSAAATTSSTAALAGNLVAKSGAGNLYSFQISADSTLGGAAWWVMIFDATSAPSGAVTPKKCYAVPSGTMNFSAAWPLAPIAFGTEITLMVSTTGCFTATASVHAFISADYK